MIVATLFPGLLAGCATLRPVTAPATGQPAGVSVGDSVTCTLLDGTHTSFTVTAVEIGALYDGLRRIETKDIARLEVREVSVGKTALASVAVLAGVLVVAAIVIVKNARPSDMDGNDAPRR